MSLRWTLVSAAIFAAAFIGTASAERLKVAVVPGIAVNLDAARIDTLSQELADALRTELDIEVIGGLEVRRKLPVEGLPPDCVATQRCIDDVARRLEAPQLLFVVMVDTGTGGAVQVDTTWVDAPHRRTVSRPAVDVATLASARAQFASAAQQLLPDAPVRPRPEAGLGRMSATVPRHLALPSYLTAAASVAGLGLGVSFGIAARGRYRDCDAAAAAGMACSQRRRDSIRNTALIADAGYVIAIGGAIATAILYATSGEDSHVIVESGPGGVTVSAAGRF